MERKIVLSFSDLFTFLEATPTSRCVVEGEAVVNAGHIITVGKLNDDESVVKLFGLCLQTSALSQKPHEISGTLRIINFSAKIECMKCTCKAGLSERCKHIAGALITLTRLYIINFRNKAHQAMAIEIIYNQHNFTLVLLLLLLFFCCFRINIMELEKLSSTDLKCYWSKKTYTEKYIIGPLVESKCLKRKSPLTKLSSEDKSFILGLVTQKLPKSNISKQITCRQVESSGESSAKKIKVDLRYNNIFKNIEEASLIKNLKKIIPQRQCCANILESMVNVNIKEIAIETLENRERWLQERQYRITASRCYHIFTYQGADWRKKSLSYFWPKSFENKLTKHGRRYEEEARSAYIKNNSVKVIQLGLVICPDHPWLGFSPDGIVVDNENKPSVLLEIKCPFTGATDKITDVIAKCSYLVEENGVLVLKKKHLYYGQVQLSMALLDVKWCHFVVYSSSDKDFRNILVERDDLFCNQLLLKLQENYFNYMLHTICENK